MIYITGEKEYQSEMPAAVTLGKFDGLHRGHQKLLRKVNELKASGCKSVVFTFAMPPARVLTGKDTKVINTNTERRHFLERIRIDYMVEYPFTETVIHMAPEEFVKNILIGHLHAAYIVVGEDFRFGYQRAGDVALLERLQGKYGYQLITMSKACYGGRDISSSYVREALAEGNLELAEKLLGYPFTVYGPVIHGHEIGRTLGLPTLNQKPAKDKLLPPDGVYVSMTRVDGQCLPGITNIGNKPTVSPEEPTGVETYLFDWEGDLYGVDIEVMLYHFIRPEQKFASLEALKAQIQKDVEVGREYVQTLIQHIEMV